MDAGKPERITLSRELSDFLIELSIAVQKHAMYPGGHPSLSTAVAALTHRAERLLEHRGALVFGVARRQLVIDGVATDPDQPVLRRLAEGLHRHHLGAISLSRGLQPDELHQALRALAAEVERGGPLGLAPSGRLLEWPHLRLHPLRFDRLELIGVAPDRAGADTDAAGRAAELWIGLARAAMATSSEATPAEPADVARAIEEHGEATAYDQVIVGYLLQIARELQTAAGAERAMLRDRTARLIGALRPETLRRLIEMGGDRAQRRAFVLNATSGMAVDAVIDILEAAADASGQTISHGLARMLSKLAAHAELGPAQVRPLADGALREQVGRLLAGWDLADPNPDAYRRTLQRIAQSEPIGQDDAIAGFEDDHDALRVVQISLEVGEGGPLVERALDCLIRDGRFGAVLKLLAAAPPQSETAAARLRARLAEPSSIAALVQREPFDVDALEQLLPSIALEGYEVLLTALAASDSRATRRRLLDRLPQTGLDVAPLIVARLSDTRWYVVRNMLVLLQRLRHLPPGFSPAPWVGHPDPRVRYEALLLQLTIPAEQELAVRGALEDSDVRTVRTGLLAAVQLECPRAAIPLVTRIAVNPKETEATRVLAIQALGRCTAPTACDTLLQIVDGGRTLLGRPKLAAPTPICIAALKALAERWPSHPQAAAMLAIAASSPDPEVRLATRRRPDPR